MTSKRSFSPNKGACSAFRALLLIVMIYGVPVSAQQAGAYPSQIRVLHECAETNVTSSFSQMQRDSSWVQLGIDRREATGKFKTEFVDVDLAALAKGDVPSKIARIRSSKMARIVTDMGKITFLNPDGKKKSIANPNQFSFRHYVTTANQQYVLYGSESRSEPGLTIFRPAAYLVDWSTEKLERVDFARAPDGEILSMMTDKDGVLHFLITTSGWTDNQAFWIGSRLSNGELRISPKLSAGFAQMTMFGDVPYVSLWEVPSLFNGPPVTGKSRITAFRFNKDSSLTPVANVQNIDRLTHALALIFEEGSPKLLFQTSQRGNDGHYWTMLATAQAGDDTRKETYSIIPMESDIRSVMPGFFPIQLNAETTVVFVNVNLKNAACWSGVGYFVIRSSTSK